MAELCCEIGAVIKTEKNEQRDSVEYERLPLKQRLKLLLAHKRLLESSTTAPLAESSIDTSVEKEDEQCDSQNLHLAYSVQQEMLGSLTLQQNTTGNVQQFYQTEAKMKTLQNHMSLSAVPVEKVDILENTSLQKSLSPKFPISVKVESIENCMVNSSSNLVNDQPKADVEAINSKKPDDFLDDLDFVVLKERKRMLLSRKEIRLKTPVLEDKPSNLSSVLMDGTISQSVGIVKGQPRHTKTICNNFQELNRISNFSSAAVGGLYSANPQVPELGRQWHRNQSHDCGNSKDAIGNGRSLSKQEESSHGLYLSSSNRMRKVSSPLSDLVHVKVEPVDNSMVATTVKTGTATMPHNRMFLVKSEVGTSNDSSGDELDHMLLRERMKLFSSRRFPSFQIGRGAECSGKIVSSIYDCTPISSASAKPLRVSRPRKRRKTATDSVEVAMEEDAPGLLQVLLEKGISADEIKLYGENESNEPLDDLSSEDSFSELEAVISKLFSQRQPLLKLPPLQCTKAEKASYCLACLFSLVEQARYLHFRKWPVEWGWCRDLQSFIFVFEKHHRIVLERPEYGYATYFFELVDSSPIDWQIRRLVTAMKLSSCSRVTLIENRTLTVGEELSEGEAKVLMAYGWLPNTGLGTMLNYCDRVVHDRKTEKDSSEWRSKIGKLLMDGYNGGSLVEKLMDYNVVQNYPEIKLELD